jgi:(1->4)-alpha-D-glucan 1-alpha-D-glucosylmutase
LRKGKLAYAGRIVRDLAGGHSTTPGSLPLARSRRLRKKSAARAKPESTIRQRSAFPGATYRFQFHSQFKFSHAETLVDYLKELGITHCYASPIFTARPGSMHGYDVCNFERVSDAAGGESHFLSMSRRLRSAGMGLVLDIVPNHMASDCANDWWYDVLRKGLHSKYARWFDIDWESDVPGLRGKVLAPILEDSLSKVVDEGKIKLFWEHGHYSIHYYDRIYPVSPESSAQLDQETSGTGRDRLLHKYNAKEHRELLKALLQKQHYLLAFWRDASDKLDYRRFFDVSEFVCTRVEQLEVFEAIHRLPLRFIKDGLVTGLRVDHPDGLWDPTTYFRRLQRAARHASGSRRPFYIVAEKILTRDEQLPDDWPVAGTTGYEFINRLNGLFIDRDSEQVFTRFYNDFTRNSLDFEEAVRSGKRTVLSNSLRIGVTWLARKLRPLLESDRFTFENVWEAVRAVVVNFPVYRTYISEHTVRPNPFEAKCINQAIAETLARRPEIDGEILRQLRSILLLAHPKSRQPGFHDFVMRFQQLTGPAMAKGLEDTAFYNYTRLISLNEVGGDPGVFGVSIQNFHEHNQRMAYDWPHTLCATSTHDTKRGEDARARINVLSEYPKEWRAAVLRWTKMNSDKRTRLWGKWAPVAADEYLFYQMLIGVWPFRNKCSIFGLQHSEPDLAPLRERVIAFMLKASKEAKQQTSWLEPNEEYETAVKNFVSALLDEETSGRFLSDFESFHKDIAHFGWLNSLSQVLLKTMSPGVPDIYQGCELWDFSMVDPDNRRPVDFTLRKKLLNRLAEEPELALQSSPVATAESGARHRLFAHPSHFLSEMLRKPESGAVKMYVLWRALNFRQRHPDIFDKGAYLPLLVEGAHARHVIAFARHAGKQQVIAVASRLISKLCKKKRILPLGEGIWADTAISLETKKTRVFTNIMTGNSVEVRAGTLRLADILADFPVAILSTPN